MFDPILKGIGAFLGWLDSWAGNYLLVLLIFSVLVELLFLPFGIKQQKNSIRQAKLRPKEMAIRKKYAGRNDRATQQKIAMEIQELYKQENYNQFGGCLPMLLQLPIIMMIYSVVIDPLKYVVQLSDKTITAISNYFGTSGSTINLISKIKELGTPVGGQFSAERCEALLQTAHKAGGAPLDAEALAELTPKLGNLPDFNVFGINLGEIPTLAWNLLLIVPVLTFVVYFFSMKLTRKLSYQPTTTDQQAGCSNNVMDFMMPMFSLFISFSVPAAVGVYWIFKSILGTLKQFILFKLMPLPKFTEEDYKAAEKELKGKAPVEREIDDTPRKSLCDDDDDEPYPTFVGVKGGRYDDDSDDAKPAPEKEEKAEEADGIKGKIEEAPIKDDTKDN